MRHPATKGKADSNHRAIREAIELLGFPVMDLHSAGNGVEDLLVGIHRAVTLGVARGGGKVTDTMRWWLLVECKVPPIRFKPAQLKWRERSEAWPRITVTSAQDAVEQIRRMTG